MPIYTMICRGCRCQWDVVRPMANPARRGLECPQCGGRRTRRLFKPPQVIQDTFAPQDVVSLLPVSTDDLSHVETVGSRSELKKLVARHNEKYGTKLEHAG